MAMHKSLDYDFDLPSTLAGMESLLGSAGGLSGNSKDGAPTSTGALPAPVPPAPASNPSAVASGDAYIIPGSLDFFAAAQQQRAQQRVQKTADAAAAAQAQAQVQPQQPVKVEAAPEKAREAAAAAAAPLPDAAPAQFPPGMTMADLRQLFARAVRQEITFEEVERQLGQQGLLPQETASEEELPAIQPLHSGLDDMRSIENGLPNYNADEDMPAVGGQGGVAV